MPTIAAVPARQSRLISSAVSGRLAASRALLGAALLLPLLVTLDQPRQTIAALAIGAVSAPLAALTWYRSRDDRRAPDWALAVESAGAVIGLGLADPIALMAIGTASLSMVALSALERDMAHARIVAGSIVISTFVTATGHALEPAILVALLTGQAALGWMLAMAVTRAIAPLQQSLRDLADLNDSVAAVLWESNPHTGEVTNLSGAVQEMMGYSLDDARQTNELFRSWIHPDDLDEVWIAPSEVYLGMEPVERTYRIVRPDGEVRHIRDTVRAALNSDNRLRLRGLLVDITELVSREVRVEQLVSLVERSTDAVLIADRTTGVPEMWNEAARRFFAGEQISTEVRAFLRRHPSLLAAEDGHVEEQLADDGLTVETVRIECQDLADHRVGIRVTDSSASTRRINQLVDRAGTDELTGLANRRRFTAELADRLERDQPTAVFIIDLDRFKQINDSLGHTAGDEVLMITTQRLLDACRADDLVARLGGDEFAVLADAGHRDDPDRPDVDAMHALGQRFASIPDERYSLRGIKIHCGLSVGLAVSPTHGSTDQLLISRADAAMYSAKSRGGGFEPFDDRHHRDPATQARLMAELPEAAERGDLVAFWQPQHDLRDGRLIGAEALVRWRHPELGLLTPDRFIEAAELADSVAIVSRVMIRRAGLHLADEVIPSASVNISARDLHRASLLDEVSETIDQFDLAPGSLTLELTETSEVGDNRAARERLQQLRRMGARIALDDVGTGHSSFQRLTQLPVDELKIDRSFVSSLDSPASSAVVRAVLQAANELGLHVVAEGVEDARTARMLADMGCIAAQGYHFSKPLGVSEFRQYIGDRNGTRPIV